MCWFWIAAQKLNLRFWVNGWKMHPVMSVQLLCLQSVVRRWDWGRGRDIVAHLLKCSGQAWATFTNPADMWRTVFSDFPKLRFHNYHCERHIAASATPDMFEPYPDKVLCWSQPNRPKACIRPGSVLKDITKFWYGGESNHAVILLKKPMVWIMLIRVDSCWSFQSQSRSGRAGESLQLNEAWNYFQCSRLPGAPGQCMRGHDRSDKSEGDGRPCNDVHQCQYIFDII